jgi:hypothetical protein
MSDLVSSVLAKAARKASGEELLISLARRTRTPDQSYFQKGGARPSAQWEINQPFPR